MPYAEALSTESCLCANRLEAIQINSKTGSPINAVPMKNTLYPTASTATPENPASHFGNNSIIDDNSAYCVAE